jgi:RNA-directed DNA polymerase
LHRFPLVAKHPHRRIADGLASACLAGGFQQAEILARGTKALGKRRKWLARLVEQLVQEFGEGKRPSRTALVRFVLASPDFQGALRKEPRLKLAGSRHFPPAMCSPEYGGASWPVPAVATPNELADWLSLLPGELAWFADLNSLQRSVPIGPVSHYDYHWIRKRGGSFRLVESPKARLKSIQRKLLREIIDRIPPHDSAHGFRHGRSICSFVQPHVGRRVILKLDLQDFFPTITRWRVTGLFLSAGYPDAVAQLLGGICTNAAPSRVRQAIPGCERQTAQRLETLYGTPHLPQGAPSSPGLANLCAFKLDARLTGLARAAGGTYSRYADDLLFSGDAAFARSLKRFHIHASAIVLEEGFAVNFHKTQIQGQSMRQRAAGLVINSHANVPRREYDNLKATLHNAIRFGPASQNRVGAANFRDHVGGRISFVEMVHPAHGAKLRQIFERIVWSD